MQFHNFFSREYWWQIWRAITGSGGLSKFILHCPWFKSVSYRENSSLSVTKIDMGTLPIR